MRAPWRKPMSWKRGMRAVASSLPDLVRLDVRCSSTLTILFLMGTCATSGTFRSQVREPSSSACFRGLVCFWLPMFTFCTSNESVSDWWFQRHQLRHKQNLISCLACCQLRAVSAHALMQQYPDVLMLMTRGCMQHSASGKAQVQAKVSCVTRR